jgi:hypothetical protein
MNFTSHSTVRTRPRSFSSIFEAKSGEAMPACLASRCQRVCLLRAYETHALQKKYQDARRILHVCDADVCLHVQQRLLAHAAVSERQCLYFVPVKEIN